MLFTMSTLAVSCIDQIKDIMNSLNWIKNRLGLKSDFYLLLFPFTLAAILEKLLSQENRVLEYWTSKKKRLDQHQQFCLFERSARQSLEWIKVIDHGQIVMD